MTYFTKAVLIIYTISHNVDIAGFVTITPGQLAVKTCLRDSSSGLKQQVTRVKIHPQNAAQADKAIFQLS